MDEVIQGGQHLDADTLTAFVEQALPEHERLACLTHLGVCARCREIVFLARGEDVVAVPEVETGRSWWRWPSLGWAGAMGAMACGLSTWSMVRHHADGTVGEAHPAVVAKNAAPAAMQDRAAYESVIPAPQIAVPAAVVPAPAIKAKLRIAEAPKLVAPRAVFEEPKIAVADVANALALDQVVPAKPALHGAAGGGLSDAAARRAHQNQVSNSAIAAAPPPPPASAAAPVAVMRQATGVATVAQTVTVAQMPLPAAAPMRLEGVVSAKRMGVMAAPMLPMAALPDGRLPVTSAKSGARVVGADAAGAVYLSVDGGQRWTAVNKVWEGKVVRLETGAGLNGQKGEGGLEFRLVTDGGAVWSSGDGVVWVRSK